MAEREESDPDLRRRLQREESERKANLRNSVQKQGVAGIQASTEEQIRAARMRQFGIKPKGKGSR